jgi:hypothetical protein
MFGLTTILEIVGRVFNFAQTVRTPCLIWMRSGVFNAPFAPNARPGPGWKTLAGVFFWSSCESKSFVWAHGRRRQIVIVTAREVVAALKDLVL